MTRYFCRRWDESRGDEQDDSGPSDWYFEVGDDGAVSRQVEIYDHGPTLRYGREYLGDEHGGLASAPLDLCEFEPFEVSRDAFELVWRSGGR